MAAGPRGPAAAGRRQRAEADQARNQQILAFIENELGRDEVRSAATPAAAVAHFEAAIDLDPRNVPAYLNLGDVADGAGQDRPEAAQAWERVTEVAPERAYLAFDRLESLYRSPEAPDRFQALCRRLMPGEPEGLARAPGAGPQHHAREGRTADALELLFEALSHSPHALTIHQAIWQALVALGPRPRARQPLHRADAPVGVLPRSPRLPAVPLPQHGTAVAVPALPRVGHVRRGPDRARRRTCRLPTTPACRRRPPDASRRRRGRPVGVLPDEGAEGPRRRAVEVAVAEPPARIPVDRRRLVGARRRSR